MRFRVSFLNRAVLLITGVSATTFSGCAISDPYASHSRPTGRTTVTVAPDGGDPAPERGGTVSTAARRAAIGIASRAGQSTPEAALVRYAQLYVNWSALDVVTRQRELASISLGQARAQALQAAASGQHDKLLIHSRVTNRGQVVAVARGQRRAAQGWVVVTREQTVGDGDYAGLPPTVHVIYAKLIHTQAGWVVNVWSPQN